MAPAPWHEAARIYLGLAVRLYQAGLGPPDAALSAHAQDDFVAARQADKAIGADDLGRWLTCARLLAATHLAATVEMGHYQEARRLDDERRERLKARDVSI